MLLAACATAAPRPDVLAAGRTDRDKAQDGWRKPAELLSFCGPPPGARVANTSHSLLAWDAPLPAEARDLDAVYSVAVYHDAINEGGDAAKMNGAIFAALKSGGVYCVVDNSAKDGTGSAEVGRLHRIDEARVRQQIAAAGFRSAGDAPFLRNPQDARDWNADPGAKDPKMHTQDRFVLRFVKP